MRAIWRSFGFLFSAEKFRRKGKSNDLTRENLRPRFQLHEFYLPVDSVQNFAEDIVDEFELFLIEPKRDGKRNRFAGLRAHERVVHALVVREVRAVVIDRLLKIAHHRKTSGARRINFCLEPAAGRVGRSRHFQQNGKLRGIGILRFVENDDGIELTNAARRFRMLQEFIGERDLVVISDDAALEAEVAIIALHFGGDADGGLVYPTAQRNKRALPDFIDALRRGGADRPAKKSGSVTIAIFPGLKLRDGVSDRVAFSRRHRASMNFAQINLWTRTRFARME